jgi:plastocyanin
MSRARRGLVAAAIVATALGQAMPAQSAAVVRARCNFFDPAKVGVQHGTRVVWRGACATHTVTAYGGNWSKDVTISRGQTTGRTFKKAGLFKFRCRFHSTLSNGVCSGMCGRVRVT